MDDDRRVREALAVLAETIPTTTDLDEVLERVSERHHARGRRAQRQARWWTRPPARRRTLGVTVAATVAAAAVLALVVGLLTTPTGTDSDRPDRVDTGPAEPPSPRTPDEPETATGWQRLWATGLEQPPTAAVWTDDQLALWGTALDTEAAPGPRLVLWPAEPGPGNDTTDADGRGLSAPAPIPATDAAFAVWTGTEVVVFDNGAAAAYRPDTDTWRELPAPPAAVARRPTVMAWTGREVIAWGDLNRSQPAADGAAFDPGADRWRPIATAPQPINQGEGVWTGDELVVVGANLDQNNTTDGPTSAIAQAYDPEADQWRQLPDPQLSPQATVVAFADGQLIAWDYLLDAAHYDPTGTAEAWDPLPPIPLDMSECYPETLATGNQVLALYCGEAAVLDVRTARWRPVDLPAPSPDTPVVWNGRHVLLTASSGTNRGLWAADPAMLQPPADTP
jgi:hypothetical protein